MAVYELNLLLGKASMVLQGLWALMVVVRWSKTSIRQRGLGVLLALFLINQGLGYYYGKAYGNNYPFFYAYILLEGLGVLWLLGQGPNLMLSKKIILGLATVFVAFWLVDVLWLESWWAYPAIIRPVESVLVIGLCIAYYRHLLNRLEETQPMRTFMFWACSGWLVYFTGTLLIEAMGIFLVDAKPETWGLIYTVRNAFNVLLYLTLGVALWLPDRTR